MPFLRTVGARRAGVVGLVAVSGIAVAVATLSAPAQAEPSLFVDAQIVDGEAFLSNGVIEVGSRANGTYGSNNDAPGRYHPRTDNGNTLGFVSDRDKDGWGVGTDDGDFFTPGMPYEAWGLQVQGGGMPSQNSDGSSPIPGSNSGAVTADGGAAVTWNSAGDKDGVTVQQVTTLAPGAQTLVATISLTNTTEGTIPNVYYYRAVDPDNCVTAVGNPCAEDPYTTTNTLVQQKGAGDPASVVSATAQDGSYIDLRTDADSVVGFGSCSNYPDAFFGDCGSSTTKGASVTTDDTIWLVARTGPVNAGETATIVVKYVLSQSAAQEEDSPTTTTTTTTEDETTTTTEDESTTTTTSAPSTTTTTTSSTTTTTTTTAPQPAAERPDAPAHVKAKGRDEKAVVSFHVPASGGSPITGYEYRIGTGAWKTATTRSIGDHKRAFTVTGLTNGTTYEIQVRAVNEVGSGSPSSRVEVFVNAPAPAAVPAPKGAVKVPAEPREYKGKKAYTKARGTAHDGTKAADITKLDDHQLVEGEAATLSKKGLFAFDSAELSKRGRAEVKLLARHLKAAKAVRCEGYTDYAGPADNHRKLSRARAVTICKALKHYGADVKTTVKGYGGSRPVIVGGTAKSRAENRRVVVVVTADHR